MHPFAVGFLVSHDVQEGYTDTEFVNSSVKIAVLRVGTVVSSQARLPKRAWAGADGSCRQLIEAVQQWALLIRSTDSSQGSCS